MSEMSNMHIKTQEYLPFSVSICVYGGDNPEWFKMAIDSILQQTLSANEIVLVVDGPVTKELETIISKLEENPIFKIVRIKINQGHGNARRIGLQACTYDLVALMDADDISLPDRFEKQIRKFQNNPDLSIVGGNIAEFIDTEENIVGYRLVPEKQEDIERYLKKRCPFNQVAVMFRKNDVQSVGGYIDWYCEEDYYLWLRMYLAKMKFCNIFDILVNVRVGEDMYRRRGGWKYFKSEVKLQKYMLQNRIIHFGTYVVNVMKRFVVQVLLPNKIRGWVFKKFARKGKK